RPAPFHTGCLPETAADGLSGTRINRRSLKRTAPAVRTEKPNAIRFSALGTYCRRLALPPLFLLLPSSFVLSCRFAASSNLPKEIEYLDLSRHSGSHQLKAEEFVASHPGFKGLAIIENAPGCGLASLCLFHVLRPFLSFLDTWVFVLTG
ncbi:unnamed protein product, partial [Phaeothamnion confervicola]